MKPKLWHKVKLMWRETLNDYDYHCKTQKEMWNQCICFIHFFIYFHLSLSSHFIYILRPVFAANILKQNIFSIKFIFGQLHYL